MKKIVLFLCICFFSCAAAADLFLVQNVQVSAMADSGVKAKEAALLQGSQQAFTDLLKKISLVQNPDELPVLAPEDVANFVQDVVINDEQTTALKYTGSLNFRFDEKAVKTFLEGQSIPFLTQEPPSFVVIPVWKENGQFLTLNSENPLYGAVSSLGKSDRLFQFQVPAGSAAEQALLTPNALEGVDMSDLEGFLRLYPATHALWVQVEKQGETYRLQARAYPADLMVDRVDFMVSAHTANRELVASKLLDKMASQMEQNWRLLQMENQGSDQTFEAVVPVQNLAQWIQVRQKLNAVSGIEKYTVQSLKGQQVVLSVLANQPRAQLMRQFEQKGLLLIPNENGVWQIIGADVLNSLTTPAQL